MNHVLNNDKISCFTRKHSVDKLLSTRQLNVLPRLKFLNAITAFTSLTGFLIKSFTTNKICLHGARSGFEPESPVHIRTWNWNACNTLREHCGNTVWKFIASYNKTHCWIWFWTNLTDIMVGTQYSAPVILKPAISEDPERVFVVLTIYKIIESDLLNVTSGTAHAHRSIWSWVSVAYCMMTEPEDWYEKHDLEPV